MRSLSRWFLALAPALAAASAAGCNQISGVDDYEKVEQTSRTPCATNAECGALGAASICRKDVGYCVTLTSADCPTVTGNYADDEAFVFASLLPTANPDGTPAAGLPLLNAMRLAVDEFGQTVNGLPPRPGSTARRPLVMLECNDGGNTESALRAARHVAEEVGLHAILGPMFSGITVSVATDVAIPNGTFLLSPTASTASLTGLDDRSLVWRTAPTADVQVDALAAFTQLVERDDDVRAKLRLAPVPEDPAVPAEKMKIAVVSKGDAFGLGLATGLREKLRFNGAAATDPQNAGFFLERNYGNPDNPGPGEPRYDTVVDEVVREAPHLIFLLGVEEINAEVLPRIEARWDASKPRPYYLSASGPYTPGLFSFVASQHATTGIRNRILGVVPGSNGDIFRAFRGKYGSRYDVKEADTSGPPQSYDAVYLLAYSVVAMGDAPLSGASLGEGMKRMVKPGVDVSAGFTAINAAFNALGSGQNINFEGASGPLDFDISTGDTNSDMQIWCIGPNNAGTNSGVEYKATQELVGTMDVIRDNESCDF